MTSGLMFAQTATATPGAPAGHVARRGHRMQRMTAYLNLSPDQKAQAKQIFADARQEAAPLRAELKANRQALAAAVKSGNDAQIDQITKANAPVMAQLAAIRAHAFEKFYAALTPGQKTKADNMRQMFHRGGLNAAAHS